jgi:hypothetical protein
MVVTVVLVEHQVMVELLDQLLLVKEMSEQLQVFFTVHQAVAVELVLLAQA